MAQFFSKVLSRFNFQMQNKHVSRSYSSAFWNANKHLFNLYLRKNIRRQFSLANSQLNETREKPDLGKKIKFTFVNPSETVELEGFAGQSVYDVYKEYNNDFEGCCGGHLNCRECHVHVEEKFRKYLPEPSQKEEDMLAQVADILWRPNSRLSCQLFLNKDLEGACFTLPYRK